MPKGHQWKVYQYQRYSNLEGQQEGSVVLDHRPSSSGGSQAKRSTLCYDSLPRPGGASSTRRYKPRLTLANRLVLRTRLTLKPMGLGFDTSPGVRSRVLLTSAYRMYPSFFFASSTTTAISASFLRIAYAVESVHCVINPAEYAAHLLADASRVISVDIRYTPVLSSRRCRLPSSCIRSCQFGGLKCIQVVAAQGPKAQVSH